MKIIAGLGNPGDEYRFTRHNFGFIVVDRLSKAWRIPLSKEGDFFCWGEGVFGGKKVFLIKPLTYMNASGRALAYWFRKFPVNYETVLVIHDDLDLPEGAVRLKKGVGH